MKMRRLLTFIAVVFCLHNTSAQKKIILEKMRCLSAVGPTMSYLKDAGIKRTIASHLNRTFERSGFPSLADTSTLANIEFPSRLADLNGGDVSFNDKDTSLFHLYLDLFETLPGSYFAPAERLLSVDTNMQTRAKTVFLLRAYIFRSDKKQVFGEELNVVITNAESVGMGVPYSTRLGKLFLTPKAFTEMFRAATGILFDPKNELTLIEIKASPAFMVDDYILPQTTNKPRTFVTTNKSIGSYVYQGQNEMIRLGVAEYEEIILKGKKAQSYNDDFVSVVKSRPNYASSDFVFLRQVCRDVVRDKNYLVKLCVQVDPATVLPEPYTFTNFLPLDFHYLFLENDTLARFTIQTNKFDETKKIVPAKVFNGVDSSSFFTIAPALQPEPVRYEYIVKGTIAQRKFTVKCSGNGNTVKEIFIDDKLVCIAQGKFNPEKFVVFDASLSSDILNPLLMIGFNRFFE